ncbi:uncharacterized protein [Lolium perenne]|uniref:uncharacterized protein n=1 Tax=Lolium perenne TaxID=4522 RepID=UPI0021EABD2F
MLQVNVLLMVNAILMGVMVRLGAYGHRYHHPFTRFLFKGATILFLPIVSYIVSTTGSQFTVAVRSHGGTIAVGDCDPSIHTALVLVWTAFVQIIGINTTAIVAADVREGRSIAPPATLLVKAVWTTYLAANIMLGPDPEPLSIKGVYILPILVIFAPFALIFAKIFFKYYAWYSARQSFSFGRNPCFIVGYMMEQLPAEADHRITSQHVPPPLIVSNEDTMVVGTQPHGYRIMCSSRSADNERDCSLVTVDKIWELDDTLLNSRAQLKDVCFSFALFKILRCRFAKFTVVTEEARDLVWHMLLEDGDSTRTLRVIETELSFLHDYYYSSLPISYSKDWLPISSIFISLLSIGYCLFGIIALIAYHSDLGVRGQIRCNVSYKSNHDHNYMYRVKFGSLLYDVVPLSLLDALVVLSEVRDIASYVCSDWTKVALMCRYVSWREYPTMRKWIGLLLQCRCKLVRPLKDNMNQCSIIVLHPRKLAPVALLRRIIPLPEQKKSVKVPREVKTAIVDTLRSSSRGDDLRNGKMTWQQLGIQVGDNFLQAHGAQGTSDTLLAWHIATTIFEARNPRTLASSSGSVATHLSRYCAYLVAYCPELLPDNEGWSKSVYKATKKDADHALRDAVPAAMPELKYRQLVELLSAAGSKNQVLKEGARLGEQLVELMKGEEEAAWKALAGLWCETILYMAPSDNLDGHAEAVARGGELITLLWALLTHVSIPEAATGSSTTTTRMGASPDMV